MFQVIQAMDLPLDLHEEIGVLQLRPDIWVVMSGERRPVAVVEVKKPGQGVLEKATVLGQIYDFMRLLPAFYNTWPAFGILTTLTEWRLCWLPDPAGEDPVFGSSEAGAAVNPTSEVAADGPSTPLPKKSGHPPQSSPKTPVRQIADAGPQTSPPLGTPSAKAGPHTFTSDGCDEAEEADPPEEVKRVFFASKVYGREDATKFVATALNRIASMVKPKPFETPFQNITDRIIIRLTKDIRDETYVWCPWPTKDAPKEHWELLPSANAKHLYVVEDLGRGAHGRVMLAATGSGRICVLKFPNKRPDPAEKDPMVLEAEVWGRVYVKEDGEPLFPVKAEVWAGRTALVMPHFADVQVEQRKAFAIIASIRAALQRFHAAGLRHADVKWRNIGLYLPGAGKDPDAVVYDMGSVCPLMEDEDAGWIDKAIEGLKSRA